MGREEDKELNETAAVQFEELEVVVEELEKSYATLKEHVEKGFKVAQFSSFSLLVDSAVEKHDELQDTLSLLSSQTAQVRWKRKMKSLINVIEDCVTERDSQTHNDSSTWEAGDSVDTGIQEDGSSDQDGEYSDEDEDYSAAEGSSDAMETDSDDANSDDFDVQDTSSDQILESSESLDENLDHHQESNGSLQSNESMKDSSVPFLTSQVSLDDTLTLDEVFDQFASAVSDTHGGIAVAADCDEKKDFREVVYNASNEMAKAKQIFKHFKAKLQVTTARERRQWKDRVVEGEDSICQLEEDITQLIQELDELSSDESDSIEVTSDEGSSPLDSAASSSDAELDSEASSADHDMGARVVSVSTRSPVAVVNTAMTAFENSFIEFSNSVEEIASAIGKAPGPHRRNHREEALDKIANDLKEALVANKELLKRLSDLQQEDRSQWDRSYEEKTERLRNLEEDYRELVERSSEVPSDSFSDESIGSQSREDTSLDSLFSNISSCIATQRNDRDLLSTLSLAGTRAVIGENIVCRNQNIKKMYESFRKVVKELNEMESAEWVERARGLHKTLKDPEILSDELPSCNRRWKDDLESRSEGIRCLLDSVDIGAPLVLRIDSLDCRKEEVRLHSTKLGATRAEYALFKDQVRLPEHKKKWLPRAKELHIRLKASIAAASALEDPSIVVSDLQAILDRMNPSTSRQPFAASNSMDSACTESSTRSQTERNEGSFAKREMSHTTKEDRNGKIEEPVVEEIVTDCSSAASQEDESHSEESSGVQDSSDRASSEKSGSSVTLSDITDDSSVPSDAERPKCFCLRIFKR